MNEGSSNLPHLTTLIALGLFGIALTAFLFLHATKPLSNSDFWWHLKSGEAMIEQGGLLHTDPFTFHEGKTPTPRETIILKGYWLWQVTAAALHIAIGLNGIFLLNLLTIAAIALVLVRQMHKYTVPWGVAAPLLVMGFTLFRNYDLERPTAMSFLFAAILLGLLRDAVNSERPGWVALPACMCLWGNLHGGFVVGDLILVCFAAGAVIEYRRDLPRLKRLLLWVLAGIGASFLNPTGPLALVEVFSFVGKPIQTGITEYNSTWLVFKEGGRLVAILWLLVGLYALGTLLRRRIVWTELPVALFLAWFSVSYQRNIAFFALAMLPAIGIAWKETAQRWTWRIPAVAGQIAICAATLALLGPVREQWQQRQAWGTVAPIYPEAAIGFLERSGLQGRMFNSYEYGGYLLWRLSPKMLVFIDGRGLDEQIFADYGKISAAATARVDGRFEYEVLLNRYGIDYVIQPIYDGYGNVQPLMKVLLHKPEWFPVYLDSQVYILARSSGENRDIISRLSIDKDEFKTRLFMTYDSLHRSYPQEIGFRVARAGMLIYLGHYNDAKDAIDAIAITAPGEKMLPNLRRELNMLAGRIYRGEKSM